MYMYIIPPLSPPHTHTHLLCWMIMSSLSVGGVPGRAKDVKGLGKDIIVDETSVDGKETHQQYNVTTFKYGLKHLKICVYIPK